MESNIRYKGHINITSGIIFFRKSEIPRDVTLLERTSSEVLWCWLFIFDLHCVVVVSSFVDVLHFVAVSFHFLLDVIPLNVPWTIAGVFTPHFILSAQPITEWFATLSFFDHSILPRALRPWMGIFYPHAFSTLRSFTNILTCVYKVFFLGARSSSL